MIQAPFTSSCVALQYKTGTKFFQEQVRKIDKKRQNLHALECATGCTSWICNNWTTGLMTVQQRSPRIVGYVRKEPCSIGHQTIGTELWNSTLICGSGNSGQCDNGMRAQHIMVQTNHFIWMDFELFIDQYCMYQASKKFDTLFCCFMLISLGMTKTCKKFWYFCGLLRR